MGQYFRHDDEQMTDAGALFYRAIYELRDEGVADRKIQVAMIAELHGLSNSIARSETKVRTSDLL